MAITYNDSYLYSKLPSYNEQLYKFIVKAERINTKSSEFEDILFDVKRRKISDKLIKVITSDNVVIGIADKSLPKAFRVFVAKDVADAKKVKLFIDATDYIKYQNGTYTCSDLSWFISYIVAGMTAFIFRLKMPKITMNSGIITDGGDCFVRLFSFIIDKIYKISTVQSVRTKVDYLAALYYQSSLLGKDITSESQFRTVRNYAIKITDIDDKDARVVDMMLSKDDLNDINTFISALGRICSLKDIKLDVIVAQWIKSYGTGTVFALEYFPAFSMMITNTYIGGYLDNQLTIEKICSKSLPVFAKQIMQIGDNEV